MKLKKGLTIAIILLFIGLAFAPSIHANISREMVEFTIEVCGLDGGKQTIQLTQEEAEEVDALFKSIRERLNNTETRNEAEEVFKEAVVELDKYGLLGGLSVKQAQRLVCRKYYSERVMKIVEKYVSRNQNFDDMNLLCHVAGTHSNYWFARLPRLYTFYILVTLECKLYSLIQGRLIHLLLNWLMEYFFVTTTIAELFPIQIGKTLYFREDSGNITAVGLMGENHWEGEIVGGFKNIRILESEYYLGCIGFTGYNLIRDLGTPNAHFYFLGNCLIINLKEVR